MSFRVVEPGGTVRDAYVTDVHAVRSGRGEHEYDVYAWDDREGMWVLTMDGGAEDDEDCE